MLTPPLDSIRAALTALEYANDSRALLYMADDRSPKTLDEEDVPALYEHLQAIGPLARLDLVLHTNGGRVNTARKIALLLRSVAKHVEVYIPYKARSAGTLLCLSADRIVMGPLAELSPLDPQVLPSSDQARAGGQSISTENIRALRRLAEEWFGLESSEQRLQVFQTLCERVFPLSLGTFFRADQQMRQIALELLGYHLPERDTAERQRIVDQLVSGYHAHDYCITQPEAQQLGLHAVAAPATLAAQLWRMLQACYRWSADSALLVPDQPVIEPIDSMIVTTSGASIHVTPVIQASGGAAARSASESRLSVGASYWRMLEAS
jgi:hypothetical protein